jgi:hypothetical protein
MSSTLYAWIAMAMIASGIFIGVFTLLPEGPCGPSPVDAGAPSRSARFASVLVASLLRSSSCGRQLRGLADGRSS